MTGFLFLYTQIGNGSTEQGRKTNSLQNKAVPLNTKAADTIFGQDVWLLWKEEEVYDMSDWPLTQSCLK